MRKTNSLVRIEKPGAGEFLTELATVRDATVSLFAGLPPEAFTRSGVADGSRMSVRAAAYHIAGHELHHMRIVREKYLGG